MGDRGRDNPRKVGSENLRTKSDGPVYPAIDWCTPSAKDLCQWDPQWHSDRDPIRRSGTSDRTILGGRRSLAGHISGCENLF